MKHHFQSPEKSSRVGGLCAENVCNACNSIFQVPSEFQEHMANVHQKFMPYMCSLCGKCYGSQSGLSLHMQAHDGKTYVCPVCDSKFSQKSTMKRHMKCNRLHLVNHNRVEASESLTHGWQDQISHSGTAYAVRSENLCTECGMGFTDPQSFQAHMADFHQKYMPYANLSLHIIGRWNPAYLRIWLLLLLICFFVSFVHTAP
ncbi:hypothetical protein RRG08_009838 [Elysia crispata]|uniref:C2H2-type domain-containing protein n=1 Tax=Elysia crispata TaxID=231223 RepID=A0AAE1D9G7_9GAST|nr:hypothetical protein RRG08_009838 [Elysia crispata]